MRKDWNVSDIEKLVVAARRVVDQVDDMSDPEALGSPTPINELATLVGWWENQ